MCQNSSNDVPRKLIKIAGRCNTVGITLMALDVEDMVENNVENGDESLRICAVLSYCKNKILHPYLRLLSTIGLRPIHHEVWNVERCSMFTNSCYFFLVVIFLIIGYTLQGLSCFRRDRGFCGKFNNNQSHSSECCEEICSRNATFSFVFPAVLHFSAYMCAVYLFRIKRNEQLENLMERVFLLTSSNADAFVYQKQLMKKLWLFILLSFVWTALSFIAVSVMMTKEHIVFHWVENGCTGWTNFMKVLLMIGCMWHDLVEVTIITSYFLQAQLLRSYLHLLKTQLLEHSIDTLDWLREVGTFQKLLEYFNEEFAPSVCLFTILNVSRAASGTAWLFHLDKIDIETLPISGISILNVLLWMSISAAPFVQAARLTGACEATHHLGHEIRGRPFVYTDTPGDDLDTVLLYTSSLKMKATLFRVPISSRGLCLSATTACFLMLVLGQCHVL